MHPTAKYYGSFAVIGFYERAIHCLQIMALFSLKGTDSRDKISNGIFNWYFVLNKTRAYSLTGVNPYAGHQYLTFTVLCTVQLINK